MHYSAGQDIREGDEVRLGERIQSGRVVRIILPGTLEARDWVAPDGGVLIEQAGRGLSLTVNPERDPGLVLIRRSG